MNDNPTNSNGSVVVLPDAPPAAQDAALLETTLSNPLLGRLLKIADGYRAENALHQAMSIYFELAEKYPGTPEASDALERLLEIGDRYEQEGEVRQARSLYERML